MVQAGLVDGLGPVHYAADGGGRIKLRAFWLFVCGFCLIPSTVSAATEVTGPLAPNTVWTIAGSPYRAAANVEVPTGGKLTIEPGVVVRFSKGGMIVRGTLIAQGTDTAPIEMTSDAEQPRPGDWLGVRFEQTAVSAVLSQQNVYISGSILRHVKIEYGQGLLLNGASPLVQQCQIRFNFNDIGGGIACYNCRPVLLESTVEYNVADQDGGGIRTIACRPKILKCIVQYNAALQNGGGIAIDYSEAILEGNTIKHNQARRGGGIATGETALGQSFISGVAASKPVLTNNLISHNIARFSGGGVWIAGSPTLTGNLIVCNRVILPKSFDKHPSRGVQEDRTTGLGGGIYLEETYAGGARIERNQIIGNEGAFWGGGFAARRASGSIKDNRFFGNRAGLAGGAISIRADRSSAFGISEGHGTDWNIQGNAVQHNAGGGIEIAHSPNSGGQTIAIKGCLLDQNGDIALLNSSGSPLSAENCWWGSADQKTIDSLIVDFFDDQDRGKVTYSAAGEPLRLKVPDCSEERLRTWMHRPADVRGGLGFNRVLGSPPSFNVAWEQPDEAPFIAGYLLHVRRKWKENVVAIPMNVTDGAFPLDVGQVSKRTVAGVTLGERYLISVTAYDKEGRESGVSDEIEIVVDR